jgi:DNA-binding winged helix-turn-helix (wHTH) protein
VGVQEIRLGAKSFGVLPYLVEHGGPLVTQKMVLQAVWSTLAVSAAAYR